MFKRGPRTNRQIDLTLMCGLFALALLVCLFRIGHKDLWLDEALSLSITNSWSEMPARFAEVRGASWLYYVLLGLWRTVFESDGGVRALSALFAAGAVVITYQVGKRLASRQAGFFAGLILLANFAFIQHAQEARMYTLTIMLVSANALALIVALDRKTLGPWVLSGLIAGLCFGVHYFSILAWGAQFVGALILWPQRVDWRGASAAVLTAAVFFIAQLVAFNPAEASANLSFVPLPGMSEILAFFVEIGGGAWKRAVLFYAAAFVAVAFAVVRRKDAASSLGASQVLLWLAAWLIVPVATLIAMSYVAAPVFVHRYMLTVLPALALLVGYSLTRVQPRALALVLLLGLLVSQGRALQLWYSGGPIEEWRAAADYYRSHSEPTEPVVIFQFYVEAPFRRYAELRTDDEGVPPIPLEDPYLVYVWREGDGGLMSFEKLADVIGDAASFWLILSHDMADRVKGAETRDRLFDALDAFVVGREARLRGVRVLHMRAHNTEISRE